MIPCQEIADQPKKVRKASLNIPWKYQWIFQHGALWWLGCALARKTQWTVSRESPGERSNQSSKCSPGLSLGLVMTLTQNPRISNGQDTTVMGAPCRLSPTMIFMVSIQHVSIHDGYGSYKWASYHSWVIQVFIIISPGPSFIVTRFWRVWGQYFNSMTRLGHPTFWWYIQIPWADRALSESIYVCQSHPISTCGPMQNSLLGSISQRV